MKQFFKNKFFFIIITLALIAVIVPTVLHSMGVTPIIQNAIGTVFTPLQKVSNYVTEAIDGFSAYFYKFDRLREENNQLKEQIADLQSKVYDADNLEKMYDWMSGFLEMKIAHTDYKFLAASVTGHENGNYSRILTLDVGSSSGVKLNQPVVSSDGIVGRITEVGLNWCKVTTLTQANSSVGAYVERTKVSGVCTGDFSRASEGICSLNYLPADSDVAVGDRVLSTGSGSVYPEGLVIGFVESVITDPNSRGLSVGVRCACNFTELSKVMIITSFEHTDPVSPNQ